MNLPNKLSVLRIILVPVMIFFYLAEFIPFGEIIAMLLFIFAAVTDRFDGEIARKRGLVTDLGKLLDPLADKLLYTTALFLVVVDGTIASPWGIIGLSILFARDTLVNGIRQVAGTRGIVLAASFSGKLKALLAYIYIPMFMYVAGPITGAPFWDVFNQIIYIGAYVVFGVATLVTVWSGIDYVVKNKQVFVSDKKEQEPAKTETVKNDKNEG